VMACRLMMVDALETSLFISLQAVSVAGTTRLSSPLLSTLSV
jgi:hypothetical protein